MLNKRKSIMAGLAVALFSVGFVACGSGSDTSSNNNVTPAVTTTNGYNGYNYQTGNVNCPQGQNCNVPMNYGYNGQNYPVSIPYGYQNGFYQPLVNQVYINQYVGYVAVPQVPLYYSGNAWNFGSAGVYAYAGFRLF